jgi:4,5-DOPA dioxygenase extradiol
VRFENVVREHLQRHDHAPLIAFEGLGQDAHLSIPTAEHYLPLLYIIALQGVDEPVAFPIDGIQNASIGMLSVVVG